MNRTVNSSIVSTISVYNASLFTAYIDGRITSQPLPTNWFKFSSKSQPYSLELDSDEPYVNDMIGYKGSLFITTSNLLHCFDIKKRPVQRNQYYMKNIVDCTRMKINHEKKLLFATSEERGIVVLNITDPKQPRYVRDIRVRFFDQNDSVIADIDLFENTIFLAIRNKGILRLDYNQNEVQELDIWRSFEKIRLVDPQDVKYNKNNAFLYIADAEEGLIVLNTFDNKVMDKCSLPNDDFPRKVMIYNKNCIIQGSKGVYFYHTKSKEIKTILDFKVGALVKYYNKIIFYKNKSLHLLVFGNSLEIADNDIFAHVYKYSHKKVEQIK